MKNLDTAQGGGNTQSRNIYNTMLLGQPITQIHPCVKGQPGTYVPYNSQDSGLEYSDFDWIYFFFSVTCTVSNYLTYLSGALYSRKFTIDGEQISLQVQDTPFVSLEVKCLLNGFMLQNTVGAFCSLPALWSPLYVTLVISRCARTRTPNVDIPTQMASALPHLLL